MIYEICVPYYERLNYKVCCGMLPYEILTNTHQYTEELQNILM